MSEAVDWLRRALAEYDDDDKVVSPGETTLRIMGVIAAARDVVREDDYTRAMLNYRPRCSFYGCNNNAIALTDDTGALCCSEHFVAGQP